MVAQNSWHTGASMERVGKTTASILASRNPGLKLLLYTILLYSELQSSIATCGTGGVQLTMSSKRELLLRFDMQMHVRIF